MRKYEEAVRRGVALLDEKRPGWRAEIDPPHLNLGSDCGCVLGQLFEFFALGMDALFPHREDEDRFWEDAESHGFDCGDEADYPALKDEWVRQLADPAPAAEAGADAAVVNWREFL